MASTARWCAPACWLILLLIPAAAGAGEFSLMGGRVVETHHAQHENAWSIKYLEELDENLALSVTYINQGHFPDHHRDLHAGSLWLRKNVYNRRLGLGAGVGGLYFYDTVHFPQPRAAEDVHGWGALMSLSATLYTDSRWFFQLQGNWVKAFGSFDTIAAMAGVGYQLDAPDTPGALDAAPTQTGPTTGHELTAFWGQTVVNLPGEGHSKGGALEYRYGIWRFIDVTATMMYEGRSGLIDRYGLATQLWLAKPFLHDRLKLGFGLGPYFAIDQRRERDELVIPKLLTLSGGYRFSDHWFVRTSWQRVITTYSRDADVFQGGIGYRF